MEEDKEFIVEDEEEEGPDDELMDEEGENPEDEAGKDMDLEAVQGEDDEKEETTAGCGEVLVYWSPTV